MIRMMDLGKIKIIADTNALLMPFQFNINLDSELDRLFGMWKLYVPKCVISELEGLSRDMPKAKTALIFSKRYEIIETSRRGDEGVLEALKKIEGYLITNDKILKKRALEISSGIIYLRSGNHLEILNP